MEPNAVADEATARCPSIGGEDVLLQFDRARLLACAAEGADGVFILTIAAGDLDEATVDLLPGDGESVTVARSTAMQAQVVESMLDGGDAEASEAVPLPAVTRGTLLTALSFCALQPSTQSAEESLPFAFLQARGVADTPWLLEVLRAANYLDMPALHRAVVAILGAQVLAASGPAGVRRLFRVAAAAAAEEEETLSEHWELPRTNTHAGFTIIADSSSAEAQDLIATYADKPAGEGPLDAQLLRAGQAAVAPTLLQALQGTGVGALLGEQHTLEDVAEAAALLHSLRCHAASSASEPEAHCSAAWLLLLLLLQGQAPPPLGTRPGHLWLGTENMLVDNDGLQRCVVSLVMVHDLSCTVGDLKAELCRQGHEICSTRVLKYYGRPGPYSYLIREKFRDDVCFHEILGIHELGRPETLRWI